ncbi:MAG: DUF7507 domain-containing protein [Angustibacter sp.]
MRIGYLAGSVALAAALVVTPAVPAFADGSSAPSATSGTSGDAAPSGTDAPATDAPAAPAADAPADQPAADAPAKDTTAPEPSAPAAEPASSSASGAPKSTAPAPTTERGTTSRPTKPSTVGASRVLAARPATAVKAAQAAAEPPVVTLAATVVDANASHRVDAGDRVHLTATVTAGASTPLSALAVVETALGRSLTCAATTLAAGASTTCVLDRTVTQADVDHGSITSSVQATGQPAAGAPVTSAVSSVATALKGVAGLAASQTLSLARDLDHDGRVDAGDALTYRVVLRNTGSLTLRSARVVDSLVTRHGGRFTCNRTTLAPGASATCVTGPITVTTAQARAGVVSSQARGAALTPAGTSVLSGVTTASVRVQALPVKSTTATKPTVRTPVVRHRAPAPPRARLVARQQAQVQDVAGNGRVDAGDRVVYSFVVSNVGGLTVHGLNVVDRKLERAGGSVRCATTTLRPGQTTVCTGTPLRATPYMAKHGFGNNFGYAAGRTSGGTSVRSNSTVTALASPTQLASALPRTGVEVLPVLSLALGLVLLGAGGMSVGRRRPEPALPAGA